ncbi:Uncharacterised protein [Bordetella pertussis]|nr:Uncharacterised protein [Bordetella pertussis]CFW49951.1 Uncharacterised protein [Bordetella pertussis]
MSSSRIHTSLTGAFRPWARAVRAMATASSR